MLIRRALWIPFLSALLTSAGEAQEVIEARPPARVRLRLENAEQLVGTLRNVMADSISLQTRDVSFRREEMTRVETVSIPRAAIREIEISTYRLSTAGVVTGVVLGELVGIVYVFHGHSGLPHIGEDEGDGGILASYLVLEPLLYATPFAVAGGLLSRVIVPERWAEASLAAAPGGAGGGMQLVIRWRSR